jgi:hypothetical protein
MVATTALAGSESRTLLLLLGAGLGSALGGLFLRHSEGGYWF